jgi:UbiD family decarboxylase
MQRRAEEQGKPLELAIVIGVHPTFTFGSVWRGLLDVDEYEVIGGLAEEPLEVVKCETIEVEVPANAEIVIEGEILPKVREPEGPLGEYTGYASHRSTKNVMKVKAITRRKDAIYHNIVPGFSAEHEIVSETGATPAVYRSVKESVPTVKNVNFSMSAPSVYYCYISIKKTVEGQSKQAIFAALGSDRAVKLVVVVDDDINVYNEKEVIWAVSTRLRADEGLFVVPGVMDSLLDPSSKDGVSAKIGIDATKPLEGWIAEKCTIPEDILGKIRSRLSL